MLPIVNSEWNINGVGIATVREVRRLALVDDWRISAVVVHDGPKRVAEYDLRWWNAHADCRWMPA